MSSMWINRLAPTHVSGHLPLNKVLVEAHSYDKNPHDRNDTRARRTPVSTTKRTITALKRKPALTTSPFLLSINVDDENNDKVKGKGVGYRVVSKILEQCCANTFTSPLFVCARDATIKCQSFKL
uniref:Uncharacterized protein n=1 Tax=Sipha flava TaxID=143950 RepID=A0A2S2QNM6_9HEMI